MTTNQILNLAKGILLETTTDIISSENLLLFANESYKDVWKRSRVQGDIASTTLALTSGVGTLASDFGTMYGDAQDSDGNFYPEVPIEDFYRKQLERMCTVEGGELKAYPVDTASLTFRYRPKPATLTTTQNPEIDDYLHEPIVYGIVSRGHAFLQDEELASFYRQKQLNELNERLGVQSAYEENNQRGAVMFNYQSLI